MKRLFLICFVALTSFLSAQDCVLPEPFTGNTGANMTVLMTSSVVESLEVTSSEAYLVAFSDTVVVATSNVGPNDLIDHF